MASNLNDLHARFLRPVRNYHGHGTASARGLNPTKLADVLIGYREPREMLALTCMAHTVKPLKLVLAAGTRQRRLNSQPQNPYGPMPLNGQLVNGGGRCK